MRAVTVSDFARAESDLYFSRAVAEGAFGRLVHRRAVASVDDQMIVRMNRDTLYSSGVFDLDAAPLFVTMPDPGRRYMALQGISEDHYTPGTLYAPGRYRYRRDEVGSRYVFLAVRTLVDPRSADDLREAHALQDAILVDQARRGQFDVPGWDPKSQDAIRATLVTLSDYIGQRPAGAMFGARDEVDPILHLIGTAIGWGGNPESAAIYMNVVPGRNDGETPYRLNVGQVPVDGFWSVSVYNARGYFEPNPQDAYVVNSVTAIRDADGSVTIQFGGRPGEAANHLPIMPGWNYTVRLYRPRDELIEGRWTFPDARPL